MLVARISAWSLLTAIIVLSFVPSTMRPTPIPTLPHFVEHFGIFAVTAAAFLVAYWSRLAQVVLLLIGFTALIEIGQIFIPTRHARLADLAVNVLGLLAGSAGVFAIKKSKRNNSSAG